MNQFNLISLILAAVFVGLCECRRVVWKQRSSIGDANNWVDNKVPCSSDALLFPESSYDLIKLSNFTMKEIILPKTGGFVLDARTSLSFRESDSKCKANETRTFKSVIETPWLSSSNWDITREPNSDGSAHFYNKATPHEERVPCDNDEIVFPVNNSYVIDLQSYPRLSFKSISIDGRVLSVTEFFRFLGSEYGESMFKNKEETLFTDSECLDETKCPCHKGSILDQLCQNEAQICEPVPHCSTPIKPIGHCCLECGAMFQAKLENFHNFNLQTFKAKIERGKKKFAAKPHPTAS